MGAEVGKLAARVGAIVGCSTCGTGLAIEIVASRWGEPEYEWLAKGHACAVTKARGPSEEQRVAIEAVIETLGPVPQASEPAPSPPGYADSRLPPERDDETEATP